MQSGAPAEARAGHGKALGEAVDGERARPHAGQAREGHVARGRVDDVLVDLVRQHEQPRVRRHHLRERLASARRRLSAATVCGCCQPRQCDTLMLFPHRSREHTQVTVSSRPDTKITIGWTVHQRHDRDGGPHAGSRAAQGHAAGRRLVREPRLCRKHSHYDTGLSNLALDGYALDGHALAEHVLDRQREGRAAGGAGRTCRCASSYTVPVGLEGEQRMSTRARGESAAASCSGVSRKPSSSAVSTITGSAPAMRAISG